MWLLQKMTRRLTTPVLELHTKTLEKESLLERFLLLTIKCLLGYPNERTYSILNPYIAELGTAVARGLGAVLQIGRSLVRSQLVSLEIFHRHKILPAALWPWGRLSL